MLILLYVILLGIVYGLRIQNTYETKKKNFQQTISRKHQLEYQKSALKNGLGHKTKYVVISKLFGPTTQETAVVPSKIPQGPKRPR
jgi:hypothetical protein